jgi:hypothetical protein
MAYYTDTNFKSKKALKEAVKTSEVKVWSRGSVMYGLGGKSLEASKTEPQKVYLEGPHYPAPHTWYASAMILNGIIMSGSVK